MTDEGASDKRALPNSVTLLLQHSLILGYDPQVRFLGLRDRGYAVIAPRLAEKSISFHSEMLFSISKTKGFALLAFARLACVLKT